MRKSPCCNAEIDICGGGYDGEDICPIEDYCKKCGQLLAVNGHRVEEIRDNNGEIIKELKEKN